MHFLWIYSVEDYSFFINFRSMVIETETEKLQDCYNSKKYVKNTNIRQQKQLLRVYIAVIENKQPH